MKTLLKPFLSLIAILVTINLNAQMWTGPTSGFLNTGSSVRISQAGGVTPVYGAPPISPLFEARLTGAGAPYSLFHIAYSGKIGIGTDDPSASLHIANSGNFRMSRTNGTSIFAIENYGKLVLTTDGTNPTIRGLFINNGTSDFFKVTQGELSYSTVLKIDANVNITSGDLIVKDNNGNIQFRVYADGSVRARELRVNLTSIPPDYVFEQSYNLLPLSEVEQFITKHKHLPKIASAQEMTQEGNISVNDMQFKLLEKVEELTLYLIQLNKENEALKKRVSILEGKN